MQLVQPVAARNAQVARGRIRRRMLDWQFRQSDSEQGEVDMNWDIVGDKWKRFKGTMKMQPGKLVGDQPDMSAGKRVESACKTQKISPKDECKMKEEILPRRDVLRGALAVGCTLLLPTAFSGCDSKKGESPTGSAPPAPPATSTDSATPAAAPAATSTDSAAPAASVKVSQASAKYQTHPNGDQQCNKCMNFIPPNACKRVEGQISPDGWCTLFTKKA